MRRESSKRKAEEFWRRNIEVDHRNRLREEYKSERDDYNNSVDGQFDVEIRGLVQEMTRAEEEAYAIISSAAEKLRIGIVNKIKEYLKKIDDEIMYIPDEIIEDVWKKSHRATKKLQLQCSRPEYLTHLYSNHPSEYDKMFMGLIKVDARFALFATKRSLDIVSYSFGKLSQENRDKLFARIEEFGLFEKESYFNAYKDIFKKQIEKSEKYSYEI